MRVLVTGGAGYIGSHAAKALAGAGHEPVVLDSLRTGHRWAVKWGPFVHGDIRDTTLVAATLREHRIDTVMHFAALADVPTAVARPDVCWSVNVGGMVSLLDAMRLADVERIVFSSTCATYGMPAEMPLTETTPQNPINPYGHSKLVCETILADYAATFGLGAIALRYFNVAGADGDGEIGEEHDPETHLIPVVLEAAAGAREAIAVNGEDYDTPDGTCVRDYVHVSDLARAHLLAMDKIVPGTRRAFNLGTGHGFTVREVIEAAERVTGRPIAVKSGPRRPGDAPRLTADAGAARSELGWEPEESTMARMIETAWAWMSEHRTAVRLASVLDRAAGGR